MESDDSISDHQCDTVVTTSVATTALVVLRVGLHRFRIGLNGRRKLDGRSIASDHDVKNPARMPGSIAAATARASTRNVGVIARSCRRI